MQTCSGAVIPISGEQSSSLWQEDLGGVMLQQQFAGSVH